MRRKTAGQKRQFTKVVESETSVSFILSIVYFFFIGVTEIFGLLSPFFISKDSLFLNQNWLLSFNHDYFGSWFGAFSIGIIFCAFFLGLLDYIRSRKVYWVEKEKEGGTHV